MQAIWLRASVSANALVRSGPLITKNGLMSRAMVSASAVAAVESLMGPVAL